MRKITKRILGTAGALVLGASSISVSAAVPANVLLIGDVNHNGYVEDGDLYAMRDEIRGYSIGASENNIIWHAEADINLDNKIDMKDYDELQRLLSIKKGDVNQDGEVTYADLNTMKDCIKAYTYGKSIGYIIPFPAADLNNDGDVDYVDYALLQEMTK